MEDEHSLLKGSCRSEKGVPSSLQEPQFLLYTFSKLYSEMQCKGHSNTEEASLASRYSIVIPMDNFKIS